MRRRVWDCAGGSNVCRRRSAQRGARSLDTFHAGDPEIVVTGIATTVMPTFDVLKPAAAEPIAAIVRTIFAQRDHATAIAHLRKVVDGLRRGFRKAAGLLGRRPRTSSRIAGLPVSTSASCTARTCSSGSTNRSSRGRTSSASFRRRSGPCADRRVAAGQDEEWSIAQRRYFRVESIRSLPRRPCRRAPRSSWQGSRSGSVWARVGTALWLSKQRETTLCPSTAAAASTQLVNSGRCSTNLQHLAGHYRQEPMISRTHVPSGNNNLPALEGDPLLAITEPFIAKNRLAVFRFHDNRHARRPEPMPQAPA